MRRLLLIDYSNIFWRGFYVHARLSYDSKPTGAAFGFVTQLSGYVNKYRPTQVAIALDIKPYERRALYPDYKVNRAPRGDSLLTSEAIDFNKQICQAFCAALNIPWVGQKGLEADDVLAILSKRHSADFDEVIIVSADSDLYQLLDQDNLMIVTGQGKSKRELSRAAFLSEYPELGNSAENWIWVQALTGGHNGLRGIKGIGIKKALQWVRDHRHGEGPLFDLVEANLDRVVLNRKLARLPLRGVSTKGVWIPTHREPAPASLRDMYDYLGRFGIRTHQAVTDAYEVLNATSKTR